MIKVNNSIYFSLGQNIKQTEIKKTQIVLLNTLVPIDDYLVSLQTRYNKKYDKIPTYTIDLNGIVYCHYEPKNYSSILKEIGVDKQAITIALENVGWLTFNKNNKTYYDWRSKTYTGEVVEKLWRGKTYWAAYTEKQFSALIEILNYLCKEYSINKLFSGTNVVIHQPKIFNGILSRSNFSKNYYDLSPAIDFDKLNNSIKDNEYN